MSDGSPPALPEPPSSKGAGSSWVLPVVIVIALLVGVGIGYAAGNQGEDQAESAAPQTVTITEQPVPTGPISGPTAVTGTTGATGSIGGAVSSLDNPIPQGQAGEAAGWSVKVADFNPDADDEVAQANQFNRPPPQRGLCRSHGSV